MSWAGSFVNNSSYYEFQILSYELTGDKKINNILDKNFTRFKDYKNSSSVYKLKSDSNMIKSITSKDSSENVLTYKLEIIIKLEIFENDNLISKISFNCSIVLTINSIYNFMHSLQICFA